MEKGREILKLVVKQEKDLIKAYVSSEEPRNLRVLEAALLGILTFAESNGILYDLLDVLLKKFKVSKVVVNQTNESVEKMYG